MLDLYRRAVHCAHRAHCNFLHGFVKHAVTTMKNEVLVKLPIVWRTPLQVEVQAEKSLTTQQGFPRLRLRLFLSSCYCLSATAAVLPFQLLPAAHCHWQALACAWVVPGLYWTQPWRQALVDPHALRLHNDRNSHAKCGFLSFRDCGCLINHQRLLFSHWP